MKDFKGNELNIGDKVIFCVSDNMLAEGTVLKFYISHYGEDACTIETADTKVRNIYSSRIYKCEIKID